LKRQAAPGVDGVRWQEYETGLEGRLPDRDSGVTVLPEGTRRDEPVAFLSIAQIEYCRNLIFKHHFPITRFESSCEIGLWLTANRISETFGVRLHKRLGGKLATVIDQIEHGHHVFRAY
jgi:hypothetical protein